MPITVTAITDWMGWAASRQLSECTVTVDGHRITLRRDPGVISAAPVLIPDSPPAADDAVTDPLSGLCHLRPESGGAPFVTPGAQVEVGQTLCIIEAMKMMTAIPAPRAGTVQAILATDGQTIEAGAPLMRIT